MLKKLKLTINIRGEETWKDEPRGEMGGDHDAVRGVCRWSCCGGSSYPQLLGYALVSSSKSEGCVDLGP